MKTLLTTTFTLLKQNNACKSGYIKLAKYLGTDYGENKSINLLTILKSNGVYDCLWCFRATEQKANKTFRLIACDFAESVLSLFEKVYPKDKRPREAITISRLYANKKATKEQLTAAYEAATKSAVESAMCVADSAAWSTAEAVMWAAARPIWVAEAAYEAAYEAVEAVMVIGNTAKTKELKRQEEILKQYLKN